MRSDGLITARWVALLLPLALIGGALGSQFIGGLTPCEMCMWQRWPHYAAILVAALAFIVRDRRTMFLLVAVAGLLIGTSGFIGGFHAGVEYHWWPGITPCTAPVKAGLSGLEMIEMIRKGPMVRCDLAQWSLFGISLAGFNAIISSIGALTIFGLLARGRRR